MSSTTRTKGIAGKKSIRPVRAAEAVSKKYKVRIAVAPPQQCLAGLAAASSVPILAQHADDASTGSTKAL